MDDPGAAKLQENKKALQTRKANLNALAGPMNFVEKFAISQFASGQEKCIQLGKEADKHTLKQNTEAALKPVIRQKHPQKKGLSF